VSYEDPESLRLKAQYVRDHNLGGIMYWEHSHDPGEELLDVLVKSLRER
jgi:chitinase